jgi:hypothetical protein
MNVYFGRSVGKVSSDYKKNYLFVDLFVHQSLWKINTGIRTYQIMNRIDYLLNSKQVPNVTEPLVFFEYRSMPNPNPKYSGFALTYFKHDSGKSC